MHFDELVLSPVRGELLMSRRRGALDPRAASVLPPFARARRFLEHLASLTSADWHQIVELSGPQTGARHDAARHLQVMFVTPTRRIARDAIRHGAREAVAAAIARGLLPSVLAEYATRLASDAAVALIVRDVLPAELFVLLYDPFSAMQMAGLADMDATVAVADAVGAPSALACREFDVVREQLSR